VAEEVANIYVEQNIGPRGAVGLRDRPILSETGLIVCPPRLIY